MSILEITGSIVFRLYIIVCIALCNHAFAAANSFHWFWCFAAVVNTLGGAFWVATRKGIQ